MTEDSAQDLAKEPGSKPSGEQPKLAGGASGKPRRVPKTLLFNVPTAEAIEAYAAAAAAAAQQSAEAASASISTSASASAEAIANEEAINTEKDLAVQAQSVSVEVIEKKQQAAQKQSARRVAKTLLFNEVNLDAIKEAAQAASADSKVGAAEVKPAPLRSVTGERKLRKIAKTLQESALGSFGIEQLNLSTEVVEPRVTMPESLHTATAEAPTLEPVAKPRQHFVAKTMLDHSILWDTVSKFEAKMEVKAAEQLLERANEPIKPFIAIVCKKQATPCAFVWDDPESKERFRYCDLCKTPVYNFTGLEQPEADELIFQRENRRNATLYKRADGKYMTVNCPVEVKRKRDMVYMSVGGVLLFVAAIAFMVLMPRPPKPEPKVVVEDVLPAAVSTGAQRTSVPNPNQPGQLHHAGQTPATGSDDGSFHMVNGQRVYPAATGTSSGTAPVNFPPPVQAPAATTDADESGQFWQYDGPPPGQR